MSDPIISNSHPPSAEQNPSIVRRQRSEASAWHVQLVQQSYHSRQMLHGVLRCAASLAQHDKKTLLPVMLNKAIAVCAGSEVKHLPDMCN